MKKLIFFLGVLLLIAGMALAYAVKYFGPVSSDETSVVFVVPEALAHFDVTEELYKNNFIKNKKGFVILYDYFSPIKDLKPGGYRLRRNMNAKEVVDKVTAEPDLKWVTISYCLRKEQVGEKLAEVLGWNDGKVRDWNNLYKSSEKEYFEGVYYPDTYLIPVDEEPKDVAKRFIGRFNEKFSELSKEFSGKNIKWTTGLKIASLIAREAAGKEDMNLISGIIWNRLNKNMKLQIDATMQYTLGKQQNGSWWGAIDLAEKQKDSPYNTYLHKGLPPTPICSPNIDAIRAAANPEGTDCLFYLHEKGQIHCAEDYEEHLDNIEKYLKS